MARPLVSIVIPCWNGAGFVGRAIDSALAQTWADREVIVIDDGSTDDTLSVLKSYGSKIRFETGENRGGGAARNRGIDLVRGSLIQFLDADDELMPNKLERMVPLALEAGPGFMVACEGEAVGADGVTRATLAEECADAFLFSLRHPLLTPSPLHHKANLVAVGGFDTSLPCSQERDLHIRLTAHGLGLRFVREVLFRYYAREGSVSSDYVKVLDQHGLIFSRARDLLAEKGTLTPARREAIARAIANDARHYVRKKLDGRGQGYFDMARGIDKAGMMAAFGRWYSRALVHLVGPVRAEQLIQRIVRGGLPAQ